MTTRIAGAFADFKLIKGRKVAQIVVEIPIEQADAIVAALGGLPNPAVERWVAMAPVTTEAARAGSGEPDGPVSNPFSETRPQERPRLPGSTASERKPLALASKVALTCREPSFHSFLRKDPGLLGTYWCDARNEASEWSDDAASNDAALAEAAVKKFCGVIRKRQIAERPQAVERWNTILASYEVHQRGVRQ